MHADDPRTNVPNEAGEGGPAAQDAPGGVLGALPKTRPQRASARRAGERAKRAKQPADAKQPANARRPARAKRATAAKQTAVAAEGTKASSPNAKRRAATEDKPASRRNTAARTASSRTERPKAPKQGYEPEEEVELGRTVNPPSPTEVAESVADILVELASAGLKTGGRVLRDVFAPLRRS